MKMEECRHQIGCDFYGCKNLAKYSFSTKGFVRRDLVFCESCMREMFDCFAKKCIPKPVESPFRANRKRRENEKDNG